MESRLELIVLWSAVKAGVFYGILGLAYLLITRSTGLVNFAVGAYAMLPAVAYASYTTRHGFPLVGAVLVGLGMSTVAAISTEALVVQPIIRRGRGELGAVMAIVALLFVLQQFA